MFTRNLCPGPRRLLDRPFGSALPSTQESAALQGCSDVANKRSAGTAKRRGRPGDSYAQHVVSLLSQRDEQVTEITMLRSRAPSSFLRKAETLLTRYWARADWQGREEILRTVRWLLSMARLEAAQPAGKVLSAKRAKRRGRVPALA